MVGEERDLHTVAHDDLTIYYSRCGRDGADGQNSGLRWVDDGGEAVYVEHAKVADGECAAAEIFWAQFACASSFGQTLRFTGDIQNAKPIDIAHYGYDQTLLK